MRSIAMIVLVLLGLGSTGTTARAAAADSCKQCRNQQRASMSNYAGPTCKTEYDRCMKSCRRK
jgi:hypothetical protein